MEELQKCEKHDKIYAHVRKLTNKNKHRNAKTTRTNMETIQQKMEKYYQGGGNVFQNSTKEYTINNKQMQKEIKDSK